MSMDDYFIIYDMLNNIETKNFHFYIETPGGSGEAAEEIARFLRSKFENVKFIISGESKSAGTILVLCGNEIAMTNSGSLGPIDAQMRIGRSQVSAYDYMEWVKEKYEEAKKTGRMNPFDATMVAQMSAGELRGVENALNFAGDLVKEWLPKYKFRDWNKTQTRGMPVTEEMKVTRAKEIVAELTNHTKWRSHGRSLKIGDLESLGLNIQQLDASPDIARIVYRIQTIIRLLYSSSSVYKIFATAEEKIFKNATPSNVVQGMIPQGLVPKKPDALEIEVQCDQCGEKYKIYAKFIDNPKIDEDMKRKGFEPFPIDNKLKCKCGNTIDLNGIRTEIEMQIGKKIII